MRRETVMQALVNIGLTKPEVEAILGYYGSKSNTLRYEDLIGWLFGPAALRQATLEPLSYYACPRDKMVTVPRILDPATEATEPAYATIDDFRAKHAGNEPLLAQLRNRVLVCPRCGKPNAYTLASCNACDTALQGVKETFNDNIFMGFIYGIAKGKFPYAVSTRLQTQDLLAFDDPLGISVCHLCVIPTSVFCPDMRFLFADPARGLKLVDDLMECGRQALLRSYWSDKAFVDRYFCGEEPPKTLQDMVDLAVLGFNFPPSMFQLHLQFQHGPLFPFHEVLLRKGQHYNHGRFYPYEYVRAALALGDAVRMEVDDDTPVEEIVKRVKQVGGIDYDIMHAAMIEKAKKLSTRFPIWKRPDFEYTVKEGKVYSNSTGEQVPDLDPVELQKKDNNSMKNYANPKCSLYRYIKAAGSVPHFLDAK